jgi:hypothetical protein
MKSIKHNKESKSKTRKNYILKNTNICNDKKSLYIVDYANVIYILFEKYNSYDEVAQRFYLFLCNQLKKESILYIVSKLVVIENNNYDIKTILKYGESTTRIKIPNKYFKTNQLVIINLQYPLKVSSSIDDIMFWYISTKIWFEICNKPRKKMYIVTNDKQHFDKNLFGKTEDERSHDISISRDLKITTIDPQNNYKYVKEKSMENLPKMFDVWVNTIAENNQGLESNISLLVEMLMNKRKLYGMLDKNPNFETSNFNKSKFPKNRYNEIDKFQRKIKPDTSKTLNKLSVVREKGSNKLSQNYYQYALIKYMQMYINKMKKNDNGKTYGNFYGSMDKEQIIKLF